MLSCDWSMLFQKNEFLPKAAFLLASSKLARVYNEKLYLKGDITKTLDKNPNSAQAQECTKMSNGFRPLKQQRLTAYVKKQFETGAMKAPFSLRIQQEDIAASNQSKCLKASTVDASRVTRECLPKNKKLTSKTKPTAFGNNPKCYVKKTKAPKASRSSRDSTLSAKDCCPFWKTSHREEYDAFWLPTGTDWQDSARTLSNGSWQNMAVNSWFSIQKRQIPLSDSQKISWRSSQSFQRVRMACARTNEVLRESYTEAQKKKVELVKKNNATKQAPKQPKKTKQERLEIQALNRKKRFERAISQQNRKRKRLETKSPCQPRKKKKRTIKCKTGDGLYVQRKRTILDFTSGNPPVDIKPFTTRAVKVKLFPTQDQRRILHKFIGAGRKSYNSAVALYNNPQQCKELLGLERPPMQDLLKQAKISAEKDHPWVKEVPANLRQSSCRTFDQALKIARKLHSDGTTFRMKFKSLKRDNQLTIPLGARCLFFVDKGIKIFPRYTQNQVFSVYPQTTTKRLQREWSDVLLKAKNANNAHPQHGCKLVYDRGREVFELHIPIVKEAKWVKEIHDTTRSETQASDPSIVSLDPGVRTFLTTYDSEGAVTHIGSGGATRLCRLSHRLDKLKSDHDKLQNKSRYKNKRRLLRRKRRLIYQKIRNLVDEVHWKSCSLLCKTYDVIIIPEFGVKRMTTKRDADGKYIRKINKNTTRRMLLWSHYRFRQRLLEKAQQYGRTILVVDEAYTSKTCGKCGFIHNKLGGKKVFKCPRCNVLIDRDVNGARNIMLRNVAL